MHYPIYPGLVKAGVLVVGCARREERIAELAGSLQGEKGKVGETFHRLFFSFCISSFCLVNVT